MIGGNDTTTITCLIKDDQNRFCSFATNEILFELNGAGSFSGNNLIQAQNGAAKIDFVSGQNPGNEIIVASSTGLTSDTLEIEIKNYMIIEDFEQYTSQTHLMNHWTPYSGTNTTITLYNVDSGSFGMKMAYSVGIPAFAGAYKAISMDWCPFSGLKFWIKADGSGRMLTIMFKEGNGKIWSYDYALTGNEGTTIEIPFDQFSLYFGSGEMDLSNISQLILYITKETGEDGSGELYFDNFEVLTSLLTNVEKYIGKKKIEKFLLFQNYPNPFNPVTTISFQLPILSIVELTIYNVSGEKIKTLVHNRQQAGNYTISFDGSDLTSGLYFYQLKAGDFIQTRKMVFTK